MAIVKFGFLVYACPCYVCYVIKKISNWINPNKETPIGKQEFEYCIVGNIVDKKQDQKLLTMKNMKVMKVKNQDQRLISHGGAANTATD